MRNVFIHPAGQDDNLGDSALRFGLMQTLRGVDTRLHVLLTEQSSDYLAGIPLDRNDMLYSDRRDWLAASQEAERPVWVLNAGEVNPQDDGRYPSAQRAGEMRQAIDRGGIAIAVGLGLKDPARAGRVHFDSALRDASVMSWRDAASREAAGFGGVAPDWAFALGPRTGDWDGAESRELIAVTLRFDRTWPDARWFDAVRAFAAQTGTRIVTVAQVARDAPSAVRLAEELGGRYITPPSMRHDDLDRYVRSVYSRSLAVVSDRAHALIIGATEGAYPFGSASDPQKIARLLDAAGIGRLTGHHDVLRPHSEAFESEHAGLSAAIDAARLTLTELGERVRSAVTGA